MAYFLPSYFQKRLLRYALSRLDFVDHDALNLDDLGITLGQRSVIELKSVGIKVDKIIERANLPPTIRPRSASIRILRLTIPADLHVSGIEVEIDGVDIEVDLDHTKQNPPSPTQSKDKKSFRSHKDAVNRPRKGPTSIYDPGGRRALHRPEDDLSTSHLLPSSEDLATSYFENEPEHERRELTAAVQSRLKDSTSPLEKSYNDTGVGVPEGFSLPSFVANFFAGVADRLSVTVRNISLAITITLDSAEIVPESVQLVVKIASVALPSLAEPRLETDTSVKRSITIQGVELLLAANPLVAPSISAASSPRLPKASQENVQQTEKKRKVTVHARSRGALNPRPAPPPSESHALTRSEEDDDDFMATASALDSSQILESDPFQRSHPSTISPSLSRNSSDNASFDSALHESTLFSHDEAASMYMSALSYTRSTAGDNSQAWRSSHTDSQNTMHASFEGSSSERSQYDARRDHDMTPTENFCVSPNTQSSLSHPLFRQILNLDFLTLRLPVKAGEESSTDERPVKVASMYESTPMPAAATSASNRTSHQRVASTQSIYGPPDDQDVQLKAESSYELVLGIIGIHLDMNICHLLVKIVPSLQNLVNPSNKTNTESSFSSSPPPTAQFYSQLSVQKLDLNMMQEVAVITNDTSGSPLQMSSQSGPPLLGLYLANISVNHAMINGEVDQKTSIRNIVLRKDHENVLSFLDSASLHESTMASTILLGQNDFVFRRVGERVDVSTKPIHVSLNLILLDEVLSRSGGLDSILDLANSISSSDTGKASRRTGAASVRKRSVHFNEPVRLKNEKDTRQLGLKINARVAAVVIDLVGSDSSMQLRTSAVKFAYRASKLRTSITSVSLKGPYPPHAHTPEALQIRLSSFEFVFLDLPEEQDLDRLLGLLAPSSEREDREENDILVDTLLRQRRKGSVVRLTIQDVQVITSGTAWIPRLIKISEEVAKLSAVTKYLPEDDKPGILILVLLKNIQARIEPDRHFGPLHLHLKLVEGAQISVPALTALQVSKIDLLRGKDEVIIKKLIPEHDGDHALTTPNMLLCRFIPDEMEPTVKVKLSNTCFEYTVPLVMAVTQLFESFRVDDQQKSQSLSPQVSETSSAASEGLDHSRKVRFALVLKSSAILFRPLDLPAAGLVLFTDSTLTHGRKAAIVTTIFEIKRGSLLVIDDLTKTGKDDANANAQLYFDQSDQIQELAKLGFVPVGSISSALADIKVTKDRLTSEQYIDVEFKNNLFFLETCADSTQTLGQVFGGLSPPAPPSKTAKYRTEVIPINDMFASFTGDAFVSERGPDLGLRTPQTLSSTSESVSNRTQVSARRLSHDKEDEDEDENLSNYIYSDDDDDEDDVDQMSESYLESEAGRSTVQASVHVAPVSITADESLNQSIMMHSMLDFREDHFQEKTTVGGTAHRWDSAQGTYNMGSENVVQRSPLKVRVRDVHIIWNLFDGYDWQSTREVISQAVRDIEDKAYAKQKRKDRGKSPTPEEEDESLVGDVLFNSIYISIPTHKDPRELVNAINMELGDGASETGSYATSTTITANTNRKQSSLRPKPKRLRLDRSKQHKMTFELEGLSADFLTFPADSSGVESSLDIRVRKLEIFDHVPTSTWKKFATYMHEAGEREVGTDMVHIEVLNVKPVAELGASEMVLKLTVLPLRLHVDQDALDFLTRFFEFKDDRIPPSSSPSAPPFIQRAEVNPIRIRLDFKPKRVDYAALKSGRTNELMNFIVLDRSDMVLRRVILYGVSGLDRLGIMLNNIWTPDVTKNQLPGVLAGLAPIRSLVDVGSGVSDLITVPIREYKKDGRIVRSIQKGALAFAKTTTTELVNLGAKLAIGTQQILQNTEDALATRRPNQHAAQDTDPDSHRQISLYADQPLGIVQGLRGAYASLERDLLLAKDAIVAIPGEIMATGNATGAARVVLQQAPTIILRPAIGVTKAAGQAFLGAGNTLDKGNRRRIEDKYKRH